MMSTMQIVTTAKAACRKGFRSASHPPPAPPQCGDAPFFGQPIPMGFCLQYAHDSFNGFSKLSYIIKSWFKRNGTSRLLPAGVVASGRQRILAARRLIIGGVFS